MVGCGILFLVGGVASCSRVGFGPVASPGCVVASCHSVCCVASLCGVAWCRAVPGVGFAMPRLVLFLAVGCAVQYCAVFAVLCRFRWVVVFRVVWRCCVTPIFVVCRLAACYVVLPLCCVVRCDVLRCVGSCRGGGMWLRLVVVCGGVYVVCSGVGLQCVVVCRVSCWYLVGSTGSTAYVDFRVALLCCVSLCACIRLRISWSSVWCVALGFVCVLGFASLYYVAWLRVLWRSVVARYLVVCYVVLFCCCCFRWGLLGCHSAALFCGSFCGPFRCFPLLCGLLLACFVGMLVARHCCVVWRRVTCCFVLS